MRFNPFDSVLLKKFYEAQKSTAFITIALYERVNYSTLEFILSVRLMCHETANPSCEEPMGLCRRSRTDSCR